MKAIFSYPSGTFPKPSLEEAKSLYHDDYYRTHGGGSWVNIEDGKGGLPSEQDGKLSKFWKEVLNFLPELEGSLQLGGGYDYYSDDEGNLISVSYITCRSNFCMIIFREDADIVCVHSARCGLNIPTFSDGKKLPKGEEILYETWTPHLEWWETNPHHEETLSSRGLSDPLPEKWEEVGEEIEASYL